MTWTGVGEVEALLLANVGIRTVSTSVEYVSPNASRRCSGMPPRSGSSKAGAWSVTHSGK